MTEFKSTVVEIQAESQQLFNFLNDFNNFEKLLPEQVINWQATKNNCSFTIKGMADLAMHIDQAVEYTKVSYRSESNSPFEFSLVFNLKPLNNNTTEVFSVFSADLNPMVKMMASRPLQNFVNLLVEKLKELMETN